MTLNQPKINNKQKEALDRAHAAAYKNEMPGMLQGLLDSGVLEAFRKFFAKKYPDVDEEDVSDIVGEALDSLIVALEKNQRIRSLDNYLWKIIDHKLSAFSKHREQMDKGGSVDRISILDQDTLSDAILEIKEQRLKKAIEIAEGLIPQMGLITVQKVMRYIIGAIKNGAKDISANEIADALNLEPANVRQARKRGFERLARLVKEQQLVDPSQDFGFFQEAEYYIDKTDGIED